VAAVARSIGCALVKASPRDFPLVVANKSTVPKTAAHRFVSKLKLEEISYLPAEGYRSAR
jgi:hypothetical protein